MSTDYIFNPGEPSILVEIYLPKKTQYQEKLYNTLTNGFKINLNEYFNGNLKNEIKEFIVNYNSIIDDYEIFSSNPDKVFYGYSMYEVDGVFYNADKDRIDEERTQIIRLIFKTDLKSLFSEFKTSFPNSQIDPKNFRYYVRHFLCSSYRGSFRNINEFDFLDILINPGTDKREMEFILKIVETWVDYTGFFLFGYIVFQLTKGVDKIEDEIWVSSSRYSTINRIVRQ